MPDGGRASGVSGMPHNSRTSVMTTTNHGDCNCRVAIVSQSRSKGVSTGSAGGCLPVKVMLLGVSHVREPLLSNLDVHLVGHGGQCAARLR